MLNIVAAYSCDAHDLADKLQPWCEFFLVKNKNSEAIMLNESFCYMAGYYLRHHIRSILSPLAIKTQAQ